MNTKQEKSALALKNRIDSGLQELFNPNGTFGNTDISLDDNKMVELLRFSGRKYFGAVDYEDQDSMFNFYGVIFSHNSNGNWRASISF